MSPILKPAAAALMIAQTSCACIRITVAGKSAAPTTAAESQPPELAPRANRFHRLRDKFRL